MDDFGARVRSLREARGWNRTDLARKSGVTKDTIRSIETGRTRTNIVTAGATERAVWRSDTYAHHRQNG